MKSVILALMLVLSSKCYSEFVPRIEHGWTSQDREWSLSIHEDDLPVDSFCSFQDRVFNPAHALNEATCWLNQSGFDIDNMHLESIEIHSLGKEWKKCVYIVSFRNSTPNEIYSMHIGVDFEGRVHPPIEHPVTREKFENKKIKKCTK